jgi:hypothetical protein
LITKSSGCNHIATASFSSALPSSELFQQQLTVRKLLGMACSVNIFTKPHMSLVILDYSFLFTHQPTRPSARRPALDAPVAPFQMLHDRVSDYTLLILGKRSARAANEVESFTDSRPDAQLQFFIVRHGRSVTLAKRSPASPSFGAALAFRRASRLSVVGLPGVVVIGRRRLPLPDHVLLTRGAFESPNRRIGLSIRKSARTQHRHKAHRAAAFRTSR